MLLLTSLLKTRWFLVAESEMRKRGKQVYLGDFCYVYTPLWLSLPSLKSVRSLRVTVPIRITGGIFTASHAWLWPGRFLVYWSGRARNQECFQSFFDNSNMQPARVENQSSEDDKHEMRGSCVISAPLLMPCCPGLCGSHMGTAFCPCPSYRVRVAPIPIFF